MQANERILGDDRVLIVTTSSSPTRPVAPRGLRVPREPQPLAQNRECEWNPAADCLREARVPFVSGDPATARELLARPDLTIAAIILVVAGQPTAAQDFCRNLRADGRFNHIPIFWIARDAAPVDLYEAFNAGASDYVCGISDATEFMLRLRSLLRRSPRNPPVRRLEIGDVVLDLDAHQIKAGGRDTSLTPRETAILRHLASQHGQPATTEDLLVKALGYPPRRGNPEVVRTHVRHLREKLETDPSRPEHLVNVPRVGYRLVATKPSD